ncbi:gas vesicle protein GvpG [uncultured Thiodictyon sp.]|uniref:gas vesicle protein GvpG n=1 Tax=uncultured Thiodictyon sp. TaxID=1846217 RepID=UPI0025D91A71|nr:gas vesicle protein GvpG [uncultured Thiodictyon sp.]
MLLVDDLLAAPINGILWVFREIENAAKEEQRSRRDAIMASLSALYISLEQGEITEEVFDAREQSLLDDLDALDAQADAEGSEDDEDEDEDDEEDDDEGDGVHVSRTVLPDRSEPGGSQS